MNLPVIASIITSVFFGIITIVLSIKEEKTKKQLLDKENKHKKELIAKDDVTNIIMHELRTPLTSMRDASSLLLQSFDTLDKDEKLKMIKINYEQSKKLLDQITNLLDAAKLKAGRFTVDKTPQDLKKTIVKQVEVLAFAAKEKNIDLQIDIPDSLPLIPLDPLRIGEVITNLVANSVKFTPQNGKITISANQVRSDIKPHILVSVKDTGVGIPQDMQKSLFSKFSSTTNPLLSTQNGNSLQYGSGLGLYIAKGIIEAHDGSINIESKENEGTTISFTLPLNG